MDAIVADVSGIRFEIEDAIDKQVGIQPLPFPGMDKSTAALCSFFKRGDCVRGVLCPFRHIRGEQNVVCKHWLRGLCKKGDYCEFLHAYDMSKMPECYFFQRYGVCGNADCQFLHINPEERTRACPWYDRGFCKHGAACKNRHVRKVMCQKYVIGFCPDGPDCKFAHPRFELPVLPDMMGKTANLTCHNCHEVGHKAATCPRKSIPMGSDSLTSLTAPTEGVHQIICNLCKVPGHKSPYCPMKKNIPAFFTGGQPNADGSQPIFIPRPLETVTCFKCGQKGHYANRCTGRMRLNPMAFLSDNTQPDNAPAP